MSEIKYIYDDLNRLVEAATPDGRITRYTYDPAGNRTSVTVFSAAEAPEPSPLVPPPPLPVIPPVKPETAYVPPSPTRRKWNRLALALGIFSIMFFCACLVLSLIAAYFWL